MRSFIAAICIVAVFAAAGDEKKTEKKAEVKAVQITDEKAIKACADATKKGTEACAAATKAAADKPCTGKTDEKKKCNETEAARALKCPKDVIAATAKCMTAGSVSLIAGAAFVATAAALF